MRLSDDHPSLSRTPSPDLLEHRSLLVDTIDPSTLAGPSASNGHLNGAAFSNGHGPPRGRDVAKVSLAGTALYDGSHIDREEFVRLVIQSLRDVGYVESADVLEAESGYRLESAFVAAFREAIIKGRWDDAEDAMQRLGTPDEDDRRAAKFLISQQKYLELLEEQDLNNALVVLRTELAPLNVDSERLQILSSLLMLADAEEVRRCAGWDGAGGKSRQRLLLALQHYIPSSVMIPSRRFDTLLEQAREYQRNSCLYHNNNAPFSLYADHACDQSSFPSITTIILAEHNDEVWDLKWSHDGCYLATASSDCTAIIWRIGPSISMAGRECVPEHVLRTHTDTVNGLAWSPDDETLLTCADQVIKMWKTKTGVCMRDLTAHKDIVTAVEWLPDGSGFISAGMDSRVVFWDSQGKQRDAWDNVPIRITDIATSPDGSRFIAVGISREPTTVEAPLFADQREPNGGPHAPLPEIQVFEKRVMIWNWTERRLEASLTLEDYGEVTSVKISRDSRFALIGHGPDEVQLWDLEGPRMVRKYTGHRQGKNVIRSCFGGEDENFIVSGSENGKVYIWHRGTGELVDALSGHGQGSVNCVAWNPRIRSMLASCSDDGTVRIWESPAAAASIDGTSQPKGKQRWDTDVGHVR